MHGRVTAYIGLGSNLEDPVAQIHQAVVALGQREGMELGPVSELYRSPPMGPQDQPDFVNAVARVVTALDPLALLDVLQAQEQAQARRRGRHWGPRTLDLDLLLYGNQVLDTERLTVPPPGLHLRAFVLYPLAELAPGVRIPGRGSLQELLAVCPREGVRRLREDTGSGTRPDA